MSAVTDGWEPQVSLPVAAAMDVPCRALLLDAETGLPNARWMRPFVVGRTMLARRTCRPLTLAVAAVGASPARPVAGPSAAIAAAAFVTALRDSDTVARLDDGRFAAVLEDTSTSQALMALERVHRALAATVPTWHLWAGVGTCPSHSLDPEGLWRITRAAQRVAARQDQACFVVADAD